MKISDLNTQSTLAAAAAEPVQAQQPLDGVAPTQQGITFLDEHCACEPSRKSKIPCIDEAIVLNEIKIHTATHTRTGGDPLIVRGHATPGSAVRIFNPDLRGWPAVGTATAGTDGKFAVEVTDVRFFARGDRVIAVAQEQGKVPSAGIMKDTVAITDRTHIHDHFVNGVLVSTATNSSRSLDGQAADDRAPYYDETRVQQSVRWDNNGLRLQLVGAGKAVPPGSRLSLATGAAHAEVRAGDDGAFSLAVGGAQPGRALTLRVTDVHGRASEVVINVPSLGVDVAALSAGAQASGPSSVRIHAQVGAGSDDTVIVRNTQTGASSRLAAGSCGEVTGELTGLSAGQVLEVGVASHGARSDELPRLVVLERQGKLVLQPLTGNTFVPNLTGALEAATLANRGDTEVLSLGAITNMPPFGRVDILRAGKVAYRLTADHCGVIAPSALAHVAAGQELSFSTYDAAGRRVGVDVPRFCAPACGEAAGKAKIRFAADNHALSELAARIGSGEVGLPEGGDSVQLRARLKPRKDRGLGIDRPDSAGRIEVNGNFMAGAMPEADKANDYDSAHLSVVDWDTGVRSMVFELYQNGKLEQHSVRVALPKDGLAPSVRGQTILPSTKDCIAMLARASAFVGLAQQLGAKPGDAAFDGPMRVARTLIHALDQIAAGSDAATAAAILAEAQTALNYAPPTLIDGGRFTTSSHTEARTPKAALDSFWQAYEASQPKKARDRFGLGSWGLAPRGGAEAVG